MLQNQKIIKDSKPENCAIKVRDFTTNGQANISFVLDWINPHRVIDWIVHTCDTDDDDDTDQFDMIIEIIMSELGSKIDYKIGSITWDVITRPMRCSNMSQYKLQEWREDAH